MSALPSTNPFGSPETTITAIPLYAPTISGTIAGQGDNDASTVQPFSNVQIGDGNAGAQDALTITLTNASGQSSDANGILSGTGLTKTGVGTYTLPSGTHDSVQAALQALVFTPTESQVAPNSSVTTGFTLSLNDGLVSTVSDGTTSVVTTAAARALGINGATTTITTDQQTAMPFSGMTLTDPNFDPTDTVTVQVSYGALGQFGNFNSRDDTDANGIFAPWRADQDGRRHLYADGGLSHRCPGRVAGPGLRADPASGRAGTEREVVPRRPDAGSIPELQLRCAKRPLRDRHLRCAGDRRDHDHGRQRRTDRRPVLYRQRDRCRRGRQWDHRDGDVQPGQRVVPQDSLQAAGFTGQNGSYTLTTGTDAATLTSDLRKLVFTPTAHQTTPGSGVTTNFTLSLDDQHGNTPSDGSTGVVATATETAPVIGGTVANQPTTDAQTATPFSGVTITDPDFGAAESTTITVTAGGVASDADGTFVPMAGLTETSAGTYTLASDTPSNVQAALRSLVFTPSAHQVAPNTSVTTGFSLSVSDGIAAEATTDSTTSVVATATETPPAIGGTAANQAITDAQTATPFSGVTITDPDFGAAESTTITVTAGGVASDADGTLAPMAGLTETSAGIYTLASDTPSNVQAALQALVFTPTAHQVTPGTSVTTGFSLAVSDGIATATTDSTTSVVATATETAPAIGGTAANQAITDAQTATPFSGVTITDPDFGAAESTTITVTAGGVASDANGTFAPMTGLTETSAGTYTLTSGTPADVQAALRALVFTPSAHQVAPGASVTTGFALAVSDGIAAATTDSTTSVVATAIETAPAIGGTKTTAINDQQTASPFSGVAITDPDFGSTESTTITVTAGGVASDADGTFAPMAGLTETSPGIYTLGERHPR